MMMKAAQWEPNQGKAVANILPVPDPGPHQILIGKSVRRLITSASTRDQEWVSGKQAPSCKREEEREAELRGEGA